MYVAIANNAVMLSLGHLIGKCLVEVSAIWHGFRAFSDGSGGTINYKE